MYKIQLPSLKKHFIIAWVIYSIVLYTGDSRIVTPSPRGEGDVGKFNNKHKPFKILMTGQQ